MPTLTIEIKCGEKTCASEPGVFCRFVRGIKFSYWKCSLFDCALAEDEPNGWLQRCLACLEAQVQGLPRPM